MRKTERKNVFKKKGEKRKMEITQEKRKEIKEIRQMKAYFWRQRERPRSIQSAQSSLEELKKTGGKRKKNFHQIQITVWLIGRIKIFSISLWVRKREKKMLKERFGIGKEGKVKKKWKEMKGRKRKEMASPLPLFNKVNNKLKEWIKRRNYLFGCGSGWVGKAIQKSSLKDQDKRDLMWHRLIWKCGTRKRRTLRNKEKKKWKENGKDQKKRKRKTDTGGNERPGKKKEEGNERKKV